MYWTSRGTRICEPLDKIELVRSDINPNKAAIARIQRLGLSGGRYHEEPASRLFDVAAPTLVRKLPLLPLLPALVINALTLFVIPPLTVPFILPRGFPALS